MHPISDEELEALLQDVESERVERKESWKGDAPERARQAVCAFANDLAGLRQPGVLFVGARDDGRPAGLPVDDALLRTLADIKTDGRILPPPTLFVEKRRLVGHDVAVVMVLPADSPPVRFDGRVWIRVGPRRAIAMAQDEPVLNERRFGEAPFDLQPVEPARIEALSRLVFEQEYLPNALAPDLLAANNRTYEQRLAACKMIVGVDRPTPTVLGILVLGKAVRDWLPGAYVQFLRVGGTQWSDPILDEAVIDGPLGQVIRRVDEHLDAHLTMAVEIASGLTETRLMPYPMVAMQQLVRNAIMHRAYEATNAPVRVYWFDDRVEIHNPGGPFGSVTSTNFGQPGVTDYRNPNLAEAMRVLGFVQRFGVGIALARSALRANGNPDVQFEVQPERVMARIVRKP